MTGGFFDGPEWGTQPFTNMFASDVGSVTDKYPVNTAHRDFHGGPRRHRRLLVAYSISPSSSRSAVGTESLVRACRGKWGARHVDPLRTVAMTTPALVAKQDGSDADDVGLDENSNDARPTALEQEAVKPKVMVFPTATTPR